MNPYLAELNEFTFTRLARLLQNVTPPDNLRPINLSIGEPKHPTPTFIRESVAANTATLAQYPPSKGSADLRKTIADWLKKRFSLSTLDPETQLLPVTGSKEALYSFTQLMIDPTRSNQTVLVPNPFYMVYEGACLLCGGKPYYVNFDASLGELGEYRWDSIPEVVWRDVQMLIVCSPDNPTGVITSRARWQWLFEQSDKYGFTILADECYCEIYFDENTPPHGALQVAAALGRHDYRRLVVMGSLSKRSNAPGLRSGYVAGNADIIAAFLKLRAFNGSAMSGTVSAASIAAWRDEAHVIANRAEYARKFRELTSLLAPYLSVSLPQAAFYWWVTIPSVYNGDDERFVQALFAATAITVIPGSYLSRADVAGHNPGRGYVRIALVAEFDECHEAVQRICRFIQSRH